jgi:murein DD-endopeptidase MepM/ murein hydrolase activator NlpD
LSVAREQLETVTTPQLAPPDAAVALQTLVAPSRLTVPVPALVQAGIGLYPITSMMSEPEHAAREDRVDDRAVATSAKQVKKAKREFKKAKRKAKRAARNARTARARARSIRAAESGAFARRESAERNLGAWILAMAKYGRIRATKKSAARPGVNAAFAWPVVGRISQYYHPGHDGLDIVRYRGAPVRSMAFGVVTYVGWNPWDQHGRAFMVVVTHAGGYETLYGHLLPKRIVRVGQEVKKGEVVGYMGSTGNSTGPHLHLELRRGRTTINPLGFL